MKTYFAMACEANKDIWLPACGGYEEPFISRSGVKLLYCFNPKKGKHAYLRMDSDMIISDEEAQFLLAK